MIVAFRFHISPPADANVDSQLDILVQPGYGFYSFLIATMSSLCLSHTILFLHRRGRKSPEDLEAVESSSKISPLCMSFFKNSSKRIRITARATIALLLILSIFLFLYGTLVVSFLFEFQGLTGAVLNYLHQPIEESYSLISLGIQIPKSSANPDGFWIRFIQVTFCLFAFAMPLTHLVSLLILWLTPLHKRAQRRFFNVMEVFNAWSASEVFVISIIASLLEIGQFAQFIIGNRCDLINEILEKYFSQELDGYDKCFSVTAKLKQGCWLLFTACIIYVFTALLVMKVCHTAIEKRNEKAKRMSLRRENRNFQNPVSISAFEPVGYDFGEDAVKLMNDQGGQPKKKREKI